MPDELSVPWRRVASGLLLIALAAVTTLAIVVAVEDVDVLSTVALALAILAFGAQLASSVVQGQASSQQMLQSERLNTETQALLAEIRTTTVGLRGTVESQFETVLRHALGQAIPEALEESEPASFDPAAFEARVLEKLDNHLRTIDGGGAFESAGVATARWARGRVTADDLSLGDVVAHQTFGTGIVREITSAGAKSEALIDFGVETGHKRILLMWAPLVKVALEPPQLVDEDSDDAEDL